MKKPDPVWEKAIKASADPERVRHFLELLRGTDDGAVLREAGSEQAKVLCALLGGSPALGNLLVAHPDWLACLDLERLKHPRRGQGLRQEAGGYLRPLIEAKNDSAGLGWLREFKQREMLRIAARDLACLGPTMEITREISDVADVCLECVLEICLRQFVGRFGQPWHQDTHARWQQTGFCVLGLGKLGGQELNYSSDVDLMFVYTDEGSVFKVPPVKNKVPRAILTNHRFFNRLAELFIAEVSRMAPEGMLFRIDLRLRPEGESGPLCRSLDGFENYYAQWGQTWERMMLIKTRHVAGDERVAAEFVEMIQPFRYPRATNPEVLHEVAAVKDRIEAEVVRAGELDRNVKLGRGGIREIEFIAQSLQLLHAGRQPFLQCPQTVLCLGKLAQYNLLPPDNASRLCEAYCFLRDVEHRLQMEENLQTHTIPADKPARERLAKLMGFKSAKEFEAARRQHTAWVRRLFEDLLKSGPVPAAADPFPRKFSGAEDAWKKLLAEHSFRDVDKAFQVLREFVEGPGYVHISPRTIELALRLLPKLFALCPKRGRNAFNPKSRKPIGDRSRRGGAIGNQPPILSDPDRVVTRLDSFISKYGARLVLFELWSGNPAVFELLILLFDRSEFLAELAIRTPDLVDELVTSGRLRQRKTAVETLRDLRFGLNDDDQYLWLRRYHQAELMRIGLRDILGLADPGQYLTELSALADACLQYAIEVVMRRHKLKSPPFAIVGLGKLGGEEIDYGSDLDIIVVAGNRASNLRKLQQYALEVMDLVSARTEQGLVFHTDARLRPDGEKGLLVNTLAAFGDYYRRRAQLWEIQSLTRVRPVAGDWKIGKDFQQLAAGLTNFKLLLFAGDQARPPQQADAPSALERSAAVSAAAYGRQAGLANLPGIVPSEVAAGGTPALRFRFKGLKASRAKTIIGGRGEASHVVSFTPDWKQTIHDMRMRIEKERTPSGKDNLAVKTGRGGLMDAEFVAQALCLENGWQEANTLRALERGRAAGVLPDADKFIKNYRQLRRVEGILRRWSYEGETVLPDDFAPYYRVSVRCGFKTPEEFRRALAEWRRAIREGYSKFFGSDTDGP